MNGVGGALGTGCGYATLQGLIALTPPNTLPSDADLRLNFPILLFTIAATTLAGIAAVPGVSHVSVETATPLLGSNFNLHFSDRRGTRIHCSIASSVDWLSRDNA